MNLHKDSDAFIRYLQNTTYKFIGPMEEVMWTVWEDGDDTPDAERTISGSFLVMAVYFANLDVITDEEVAFLADIRDYFNGYNTVTDWESIPEFRNYFRQKARTNPIYQSLQMPVPIPYLAAYDAENGTDLATEAKTMFFRMANALVKADGHVSSMEQQELQRFKEILFDSELDHEPSETFRPNTNANADTVDSKRGTDGSRNLEDLISELTDLIGLDRVKNDVSQLVNFLQVQKMREEKGMPVQPLSRHLVFYGNPGTGKTTVASVLSLKFI